MGGIIRTRLGVLTGAAIIGAAGLPAIGVTGAAAAAGILYVNNASDAHCSNAGQGTAAQPFCTVAAAAAKVQPGQTVSIAKGQYPEHVTLTRSGTAEAPITFVGAGGVGAYYDQRTRIGESFGQLPHAFTLSGVQHIRFENLDLSGSAGAVLVNGGGDIAVSGSSLSGNPIPGNPAVRIAGAPTGVTLVHNYVPGLNGLVAVEPGAKGTVISTNYVHSSANPAITVDGAPGTVIVNNTLSPRCQDALQLLGASTGAIVENNVLSTNDVDNHSNPNCADASKYVGLRVAAEAAEGTKVAYNAFDSQDGSPAYDWKGTVHDDVQAFAAASGQGDHDLIGVVEVQRWMGDSGQLKSPIVDSADESAPGLQETDLWGARAADDPWVSDTGTGSGRRDRGASELVNFGTRYTPTGPVRLLDTRKAVGVGTTTAVAPGATVELPVTGVHGVPANGVTAVTLNVTVTEPSDRGFLTVYPHGDERPTASSLNWTPGLTAANLVTVQARDGKAAFYNGSGGTVHVVADLFGYFSTVGAGFTPKSPSRILDTRYATGAPKAPLAANQTLDLAVPGLPADVRAVTLNVTVTKPTDRGYLTVYPHGDERPTASSLNRTAGQTVPNLVTVPVKDGKVSLFSGGGGGTAEVIADLAGYYTASGGDMFHALAPSRVIDTRKPWFASGVGEWQPAAPIGGNQTLHLRAIEHGTAVSMNLTVTNTVAAGFLTAYPNGTARPVVSNLNWVKDQTVPNAAVVATDDAGQVEFFNGSWANVDVIVDVNGYYDH
ncbi:right-handed parallel beta-helix repeat-containing protein [Kitasatospora sp. NPDC051914]|uniref:right-handed parallel beta-helix repeat-containing protein n=1 Tax=Kitasatospora sp. NPDC051914 TaxID=3154945 RepID=UPI00342B4353